MERKYIVSVDFGSSHAIARVYTQQLQVIGSAFSEVHDIAGAGGELDPESVWQCFCVLLQDLLHTSNIEPMQIRCFGLSVQRNSLLLWDKRTGDPRTHIITWQNLCASRLTERLNSSFVFRTSKSASRLIYWTTRMLRFKTFASFHFKPILASVRLKYLLQKSPQLLRDCQLGLVYYGCLETWLLWRLTGGASFCTDMSCASATGMYDAYLRKWSTPVLSLLGIPREILPAVKNTSHLFGYITNGPLKMESSDGTTGDAIPVTAVIGDAQASTLSEGCTSYGEAKLTLGTGSFFNISTGSKPEAITANLYPVVGWSSSRAEYSDDRIGHPNDLTYLLEGCHSNTGTVIEWLRSQGLFHSYDELAELLVLGDSTGLDEYALEHSAFYLPVPGDCSIEQRQMFLDPKQYQKTLSSPGGSGDASSNTSCQPLIGPDGLIVGADRERSSRQLLVRLAVESIAYTACDVVEQSAYVALMPTVLRVNGNVSRSDWLIQRLSDVTGIPVKRSPFSETSCLGAAIAAGVGAGIWPTFSAVNGVLHDRTDACLADVSVRDIAHSFSPRQASVEIVRQRYLAWRAARVKYFRVACG